ncbi:MAG TPA: alpha-glucosidase C-terminal domain-containing protein, partial [Vicinamibacterales bacterium]
LTLEMVTDQERDYMWRVYAHDVRARINMGIRRRLAPLLENDRQRIELLNSLLFSLPGTPVVYYGDEIGMGDNVFLGDRNGVRTPMQWTADRNAGFSRADPARLFAPPIMDVVYGYQALNVEAQERSPSSLLNWMRRIIAIRKQHPVFGRGSIEFFEPENPRILAFVREYAGDRVLVIANLARSVQPVELDLSAYAGLVPVEMFERTVFPRLGHTPQFFTLGPYGVYWFSLVESSSIPVVTRRAPRETSVDEAPALLVGPVWDQMFDTHVRTLIERRCLTRFLQRQRWYTAAACGEGSARIADWVLLVRGAEPKMLAVVAVRCTDGTEERYLLSLATASGEMAAQIQAERPGRVLARITGARTGVLYDGLPEDSVTAMIGLLSRAPSPAAAVPSAGDGSQAPALSWSTTHGTLEARQLAVALHDQASTAEAVPRIDVRDAVALVGDRHVLKLLRRIEPGPHPEVELPQHITGPGGFGRVPRIRGVLQYRASGEEEPATIGVLSEQMIYQRNGWDHAIEEIARFFDRVIARPDEDLHLLEPPPVITEEATPPEAVLETIGGYLDIASMLGRRVAQLHEALARPNPSGGFGIRTDDDRYFADVLEAIDAQRATIAPLVEAIADREPVLAECVRPLLGEASAWRARLTPMATDAQQGAVTIRVHGDLQLGQVLLHQADAVFVDFEGDPSRPVAWRRRRHSPIRDVATLVHSLRYASHAGLLNYTTSRPFDRERLAKWVEIWFGWTSRIFLSTYRHTLAGSPLLPSDTAFEAGLHLLLVDQALQDLEMELRDRPDWAGVPLATLLTRGDVG